MIRVNIHFRRSTLDRLDEITGQLGLASLGHFRLHGVTRADLIRYAVAQVFGLDHFYVHMGETTISAALKKVLKKSSTKEGV